MANDGEADKGQSDLDFERECERDRRMNNRSRHCTNFRETIDYYVEGVRGHRLLLVKK